MSSISQQQGGHVARMEAVRRGQWSEAVTNETPPVLSWKHTA